MAPSADPRIGSVLVGYRIEALLGRGGMSVVYRAEDLALGRKVALKLLAPELAGQKGFRERFQRESRLAASLDHPGVVPVYEAGEVQGQLYIAMRYVEGTDLGALLRERGPLEPVRAIELCAQVADALDDAHGHGLVHRDVKPSNVLVDGRGRCYLGDFGLTKRTGEQTDLTGVGQLLGSSDYIAPEAIEGATVDGRADVYSLGCLLYQCIAGEPPFPRDSELSTLWAHVHDPPPKLGGHPALDPVIAKALAKNRETRYPTATELTDAARAAVTETETEPPPRRRRHLVAAIAVALAIAVAAILAAVFTRADSETTPSTTPTLTPSTDSIQRIDPQTNEIVATIAAPVSRGVIAAGAGSVWVGHLDDDVVTRIDPETNTLAEPITGVGNPTGIAIAAGSAWVYNRPDGIVTQLDATTGEVLATIRLPDGVALTTYNAAAMRASDRGIWLRWGSETGNAVMIDPVTTRASAVQIGVADDQPTDFAFSGGKVLVWGATFGRPSSPAELIGFDPERPDRAVIAVPFGAEGGALCLIADDRFAWVAHQPGYLSQLDLRARRFVRDINVGEIPCHMAVAHGSLWVASIGDDTVSRIDPETGKVVATIEVGPNAHGLAADDNAVWVDVHPEEAAVSP